MLETDEKYNLSDVLRSHALDIAIRSALLYRDIPFDTDAIKSVKDNIKRGMRVGRSFNRAIRDAPDEVGEFFARVQLAPEYTAFDFTCAFDWDDGDYGDSGSCFMSRGGEFEHARLALEDQGAYAIRTYYNRVYTTWHSDGCECSNCKQAGTHYERGEGRAWIWPYEKDGTKKYTVFNGYTDIGGNGTARMALLLAAFLQEKTGELWTIKYISLSWGGGFVNSGSGYAVVPASTYHDTSSRHSIPVDTDEYARTWCNYCDEYHEGYVDMTWVVGYGEICEYQMDNEFTHCQDCSEYIHNDSAIYSEHAAESYCQYHYNERHSECEECYEDVYIADEDYITDRDGNVYCETCAADVLVQCAGCDETTHVDDVTQHNDQSYCGDCLSECDCGRHKPASEDYCKECHDRIARIRALAKRQAIMPLTFPSTVDTYHYESWAMSAREQIALEVR